MAEREFPALHGGTLDAVSPAKARGDLRTPPAVLPLLEDAVMAAGAKGFFTHMVDRMFAPEPVPVLDKRTQNLAQKRMNIRAVGVREGFQAMRARSEEMTRRIEAFKKQRRSETAEAPVSIDPAEQIETIVLASRI